MSQDFASLAHDNVSRMKIINDSFPFLSSCSPKRHEGPVLSRKRPHDDSAHYLSSSDVSVDKCESYTCESQDDTFLASLQDNRKLNQQKKNKKLTEVEKRERKREVDRKSAHKKRIREKLLIDTLTKKHAEKAVYNKDLRADSIKLIEAIKMVGDHMDKQNQLGNIDTAMFPITSQILKIPPSDQAKCPSDDHLQDSQIYFELKKLRAQAVSNSIQTSSDLSIPSDLSTSSDDSKPAKSNVFLAESDIELNQQLMAVLLHQLKANGAHDSIEERMNSLIQSLQPYFVDDSLAHQAPMSKLAAQLKAMIQCKI